MSVIRTDAGRRLLAALGGTDAPHYSSPMADMIAAIEAEAEGNEYLTEPPDPAIWRDLPPTSYVHENEVWDPRIRKWIDRRSIFYPTR